MNKKSLVSIAMASALLLSGASFTRGQTATPVKPPAVEPTVPAPDAPKPPAGVNPKLTSDDPEYGYSEKKPVKVGAKDDLGGPAAERAYLDTLRDEEGKPVTYQRKGSFGAGPDGNILDGYDVETSTGRTLMIFIDMYHPKNDPKKQPAPKGLYKVK